MNFPRTFSWSTPGAQLDTTTNDGRANLPVCLNLTASQHSNAGGTLGIRTREHRSARSGGSLGGAAETVSKPHFMVAADVSRLTILGISMRLERTHVRCYSFETVSAAPPYLGAGARLRSSKPVLVEKNARLGQRAS